MRHSNFNTLINPKPTTTIFGLEKLETPTDLYKYSPDGVHPIHAVSYHAATDKVPTHNGDKFRSILATIYNQSQLAKRKHVARYWSINTAATAVPLSAHLSPLVITTKLAAAILGGPLFGGGVLSAQYCPCGNTALSCGAKCLSWAVQASLTSVTDGQTDRQIDRTAVSNTAFWQLALKKENIWIDSNRLKSRNTTTLMHP